MKIKGEYLKGFGCSTGFVNHETILKKRLIHFIVSKLRALFVKKYLFIYLHGSQPKNVRTTTQLHSSHMLVK